MLRHLVLPPPLSILSFIAAAFVAFLSFLFSVMFHTTSSRSGFDLPTHAQSMSDVDACPAVAHALMLSAFTMCYAPFAPLL